MINFIIKWQANIYLRSSRMLFHLYLHVVRSNGSAFWVILTQNLTQPNECLWQKLNTGGRAVKKAKRADIQVKEYLKYLIYSKAFHICLRALVSRSSHLYMDTGFWTTGILWDESFSFALNISILASNSFTSYSPSCCGDLHKITQLQ